MHVQGVEALSGSELTAVNKTKGLGEQFSVRLGEAIEEKKAALKALAEAITPEMLSEMADDLAAKKEAAATQSGGFAPHAAKCYSYMGNDFNLMLLRSIYEMYNGPQKASTPDAFTA